MRVLLTTDTVGGVWTFTRELTQHLIAQGHSAALVSFGRPLSVTQGSWTEAMIAAHSDQFVFHACDAPLEWMQSNKLAWAEGAEMLLQVAETFQADILHSSQFCWGALPLALPKLITAHSDVRSWAEACRRDGLAPSRWLDRYDLLVQDGINCADAIVAPTAWMRAALRRHFEVTAPFHLIANGRTLPNLDFHRQRDLRAVSAGRLWDEGKGLAVLGEIALPLPVLLAGEHSFEDAEKGICQSGFRSLGELDEQSLLDLFCTSSMYLATSLYEPFGLAPLEAALCGCAIVARDLATFREVWGGSALYFRDAIGLEGVLTQLVSHPAKLHGLQVSAAERARHFTGKRMAARYASLYRELIASFPVGRSKIEEDLHAA